MKVKPPFTQGMEGMEGMEINSGSNGIIYICEKGWVCKKIKRNAKGHSIEQQKLFHGIVDSILQYDVNILRVPKLYPNTKDYIMEHIDTKNPIILGNEESCRLYDVNMIRDLIVELKKLWKTLWKEYRIAAWDFELYIQPDGSIILLDFDKFKSSIHENFFEHPCFPRGFSSEQ